MRGYSFDPGIGVARWSQWHLPLAFVVPVGRRLSVDLSASYAGSSVEASDGSKQTITGLTDTQLRLLYTLQRDRVAVSLLFNVPTGQRAENESQFTVSNALGSNFLSFPVSGTGTALGVTGGLAMAARAGAWNLGLAGSMRYLGPYEPILDTAAIRFTPGIEARVRAGLDRLVGGRTRVLVGLTGSTFSTDEFGPASYKPGTRFIGDLGIVHVVGSTTLSLAAWDYYRLAGSSGDSTLDNTRENILNVELRARLRLGPRASVAPLVAFRQSNPAGYRGGRLYSGGATFYFGLSEHVTAQVGGRFDSGWVARSSGWANLTGYGASVLLRLQR
jgi:hypothetical protein